MKKILVALCVLASSTAAYAEPRKDSSLSDRYNAAKLNKDNAALSQKAIAILEKETDKKATGFSEIAFVGLTAVAYLETTSGEICKVTIMQGLSPIDCVYIDK